MPALLPSRWLAVLLIIFSCPLQADAVRVSDASVLNTWWIDGSERLDISGLSFCAGELLAVADKSSDRYYRLDPTPGQHSVPLVQRALFAPPDLPGDQPVSLKARMIHYADFQLRMDFEGITCDDSGVYLLSERHNRLVTLAQGPAGLQGQWQPQKWSESARAAGYLTQFNGESEGVVKVGDSFWVALERDPRGLLQIGSGQLEGGTFHTVPEVSGLDFYRRSHDLTGLAFYDGALYTLERNAYAVCRRSLETRQAEWCIRYRHIEESLEYGYLERNYAKGEGLAINRDGIFVVLDNNGVGRSRDAEDRRGLLMQLAHPEPR